MGSHACDTIDFSLLNDSAFWLFSFSFFARAADKMLAYSIVQSHSFSEIAFQTM